MIGALETPPVCAESSVQNGSDLQQLTVELVVAAGLQRTGQLRHQPDEDVSVV